MTESQRPVATVESYCTLCDRSATWTAYQRGERRLVMERTDASSSFACAHWREHHDAAVQAVERPTGPRRATVPPVDAHVRT